MEQQKPKSMTERFVELENLTASLQGLAGRHHNSIQMIAQSQQATADLMTEMANEFAALIELIAENAAVSAEAVEQRARENKIKLIKSGIQKAVEAGGLSEDDTITESSMVEIEMSNGDYAFQPMQNLKENVRREIIGKPVFDAKGADYKVVASYKVVTKEEAAPTEANS